MNKPEEMLTSLHETAFRSNCDLSHLTESEAKYVTDKAAKASKATVRLEKAMNELKIAMFNAEKIIFD
jgi:hypothetical protein